MENIISTIQILPSKKLVKSSVLLLIFLAVFYLFSLGLVMDGISQKNKQILALERESTELYALQQAVEQKSKNLTLNSFLELGYAESQKFEIIKTVRNVASIETSRY